MDKNVAVFLVIGMAIIIAFSTIDVLTGEVASTNNANRGVHTCSDSDGGIDIYEFGTVEVEIGNSLKAYPDRCDGPTRVFENYCNYYKGNDRGFTEEWCDDGYVCDAGECIIDTLAGQAGITTSRYGLIVS